MNAPATRDPGGITRRISAIKVEGRFRTDLGDLGTLAESIRRVGLLHPIVVTEDDRLLAGQRRLEACKLLGWTDVPVHPVGSLADAGVCLEIERDENTCREPMRPSEKAAMGLVLETLERPKAAERMARSGDPRRGANASSETVTELAARPPVRDLVGAQVGMSGVTYQRARAVVQAADDETQPPEVREIARQAVEQMDRTGKVAGAYRRVIEARVPKDDPGPPPEPNGRDLTRARAHLRRAHDLAATLRGFVRGLEDGTAIDARRVRAASQEDARFIARDLAASLAALHRIQRAIELESRR